MIQAKARPLAKRPVYETLYPSIKEGKFSRKWVDDFISHETPLAFSNTTVEQRGTRSISTYQLGGLTSRLQPLDVSLNKLSKDKMHHYYYH
ncbi:unnamed protein product [Rhizophagus irregularis]|nr:unnamed protein product [Rhizophagus irregularis]